MYTFKVNVYKVLQTVIFYYHDARVLSTFFGIFQKIK